MLMLLFLCCYYCCCWSWGIIGDVVVAVDVVVVDATAGAKAVVDVVAVFLDDDVAVVAVFVSE